MLEITGGAIHTLRVSGGFTGSPAWMQMMADVTGKRVELVHADDASALGAAYFAFSLANHAFPFPGPSAVFLPRPRENEMYAKSFSLYRALYPALQKTMHERYELNP
jgi:gluconokinase